MRGYGTTELPKEENMLIRYSCKDMGLKCSYVVKGEDQQEVIRQALAHVLENHTLEFNSIQSPEEIARMEKALALSTRIVAG
jgi:predicted small metal-binding protein